MRKPATWYRMKLPIQATIRITAMASQTNPRMGSLPRCTFTMDWNEVWFKLLERGEKGEPPMRSGKDSDKDEDNVAPAEGPKSLIEFFRESPLVGVELDLERQKDDAGN